jgi:hypothetical protein
MFGSRLIFGSHFPFRVAQLRDARARGGKLIPALCLHQDLYGDLACTFHDAEWLTLCEGLDSPHKAAAYKH